MSAEPDRSHQKPPFLKRVRIRNYKSIRFCDVELEPLTVLVGRNGSGKSNFVDALGFLRDTFESGVGTAVRDHGGWNAIIHRGGMADEVGFSLDLQQNRLTGIVNAAANAEPTKEDFEPIMSFDFVVRLDKYHRPTIASESLSYRVVGQPARCGFNRTADDEIENTIPNGDTGYQSLNPSHALVRHDGLFSAVIASRPYMDICDGLRRVGTYNFIPWFAPEHQPHKPGQLLDSHGKHIASAIRLLEQVGPDELRRVKSYLSVIVPNVVDFHRIEYGDREAVRFKLQQNGRQVEFDASSMSDGTLRVLATLVAAFQIGPPGGPAPSLVAIEEPETSLHPAASAALVDALDEATGRTQILITTHSTELLDNPTIQPRNVRVVEMVDGETVITTPDEASVEIVRERFDTLGGLERQNQLATNFADRERQKRLETEGIVQ